MKHLFNKQDIDFFIKSIPSKRKVNIDAIRDIALKINAVDAGNLRAATAFFLDKARSAGAVSFPADRKKHYDRSVEPELPFWVWNDHAKTERYEKRIDPRGHIWHPRLRFLADARSLPKIDVWLKIDTWLKAGGEQEPRIPTKERSYEIFRDEKFMEESLLNWKAFKDGLVSEDTLRCYRVYEPISYIQAPAETAGKPIIIVENKATWYSIAKWNRRCLKYSAVTFGCGNAIRNNWPSLNQMREFMPFSKVVYFGDIDCNGFLIPIGLKPQIEENFKIPFEFDVSLYRKLLAADNPPYPNSGIPNKLQHSDLSKHLPDDVCNAVFPILESKQRIPQEALQFESLS